MSIRCTSALAQLVLVFAGLAYSEPVVTMQGEFSSAQGDRAYQVQL